jgi:hypothetical protein
MKDYLMYSCYLVSNGVVCYGVLTEESVPFGNSSSEGEKVFSAKSKVIIANNFVVSELSSLPFFSN